MKKTYLKNIFRTVTHTAARFIAIFVIVALGVGFLVGLISATPDMRYSVDRYYDETGLFDFRILSTLGLTDEDVQALRRTEGVEAVMPAVSEHVLLTVADGDTLVCSVTGLDPACLAGEGEALNRTDLLEGRYPTKEGECLLIQGGSAGAGVKLGDILTFSEENGETLLREGSIEVVGVARSSYSFSLETETSAVGGGKVQLILYLPAECFDVDYYTDIFVTVAGAAALDTFSAAYEEQMEDESYILEELGRERVALRFEEVANSAREELDRQRVLAEEEFSAKEALLEDARLQISQGRQTLAEARQQLDSNRDTVQSLRQALADGTLPAGSFSDLVKEYDDGLTAYRDGQIQLARGEATLEAQEQLLDASRTQVAENRALLSQIGTQLEENADTVRLLQTVERQLEQQDLTPAEETLAQLRELLGEDHEFVLLLERALQLGETLPARLKEVLDFYESLQTQYDEGMAALEEAEARLAQGEAALAEGRAQLSDSRALLEESGRELEENRENVESLRLLTAAGIDSRADAQAKIEEYDQGEADYTAGLETLARSEEEYESGRTLLAEARRDAEAEFSAAEEALTDASQHRWYVLDRNTNVSFVSFESNSQKVEAICRIFPVFFFLIAVLVTLTTMTRMVDEERVQIGTLKALGYSDGRIMAKYLLYAAAASVLGSGAGLLVGVGLFPTVIWRAYSILYYQPKLYCLLIPGYALGFSLALTAAALFATYLACRGSLREVPASLMQPKAPKIGKRIFLERIGFVWKHLSFTKKVTARNLFRYKKRLYMTVIGIMGCTALLVTGFGLRDSINHILSGQFGDVVQYNVTVQTRHDNLSSPHSDLLAILDDTSEVSDRLFVHQQLITVDAGDSEFDLYVVAPSQPERLTDFVHLRTRQGKKPLSLSEDGVVLTEKFATAAGLSVGDRVTITVNGAEASLRITGIAENYVYNYVYLTPDLFQKAFGTPPEYTTVYACAPGNLTEQEELSERLLKNDEVSSVSLTDWAEESFSNLIRSIDYIVLVLILSAAALAIVVLYNLTNINIAERQKEIATIKVLGFYDPEVGSYIFREISLLTVMGTALGLVCGIALHRFVVQTAEVDMVMFGRSISPLSFVLSAVLTLLFSALVDIFMYRKLKKISMVESLKAVD